MKRSLSHLPKRKREEPKLITQTIVEMVPATQMIILFGSHARGDWVEDVTFNGRRSATKGGVARTDVNLFDLIVVCTPSPPSAASAR